MCTVTAMGPPSPPPTGHWIRGGEDSGKRRSWTSGFTSLPGIQLLRAQGESPTSCLRRRGGRYSMGFADHGGHHELHSQVKNATCRKWDTPMISPRRNGGSWEGSARNSPVV